MIFGDWAMMLTKIFWDECCVLPAISHCSFCLFFFCTTHQTSIHMRQAETTGRCLTQASTSKWNLHFFFLCQMPQRTQGEKELRLLFSYSSSVYWEWRSGVMAIGKDRKIFHLFSPLTLKFWCGNEILIKHGIKTITWRVKCDVMMICMVLYSSTSDK